MSPFTPSIRVRTLVMLSVSAAAILLSSCAAEKQLLPGEAAYDAQVTGAEALLVKLTESKSTPTQAECTALRGNYDAGVEAFRQMMPSLKGLAVRKRDDRLGKIREYTEANCR